LSTWDRVLDYCRTAMAFEEKEQFRVLFLDKRNQLIADEVQQTGTVDHTPVYPREVVKRALELSATAVLLIHNHPSGDPTPSRAAVDVASDAAIGGHADNICSIRVLRSLTRHGHAFWPVPAGERTERSPAGFCDPTDSAGTG